MVNVNKIRGAIISNGLTQSTVAALIGINPATLSRKLSLNGETFTIAEAKKLVEILKIDNPKDIFFADDVAIMRQNNTIQEGR